MSLWINKTVPSWLTTPQIGHSGSSAPSSKELTFEVVELEVSFEAELTPSNERHFRSGAEYACHAEEYFACPASREKALGAVDLVTAVSKNA